MFGPRGSVIRRFWVNRFEQLLPVQRTKPRPIDIGSNVKSAKMTRLTLLAQHKTLRGTTITFS